MPLHRLFASPGRYLQGPGAIEQIGELLADDRPILVMDAPVRALIGDRVLSSCAGRNPRVVMLEGEITYATVDRMAAECAGVPATVVVGLGGGKVLDSAKALSVRLGVPVITVPTIASNDSPTSSAIAMYDDTHALVSVDMMKANPRAVVVDTELMVQAPVHFLRSGIGDAIAKVYEAEGCAAGSGMTPLGTRPLALALAIGRTCHDTLRHYAVQAMEDCEAGRLSDAVERVVEASVLMSGLSFENGGLSLAHSLTRGLMRVVGARDLLHGYQVAWGALVQVEAEGRSEDEVGELAGFLASVGLPTCSLELGLGEPLAEQHRVIAHYTMTAPHLENLPTPVDEETIIAAIERVDRLAA